MRKLIERIEVETFSHATESLEKVTIAVENLGIPKEFISISATKGHHGNVIHIFSAKLRKKKDIEGFLNSTFISKVRNELLLSLENRISEKGTLYIRADKQDLFNNIYTLQDRGDVKIGIKILSYPFRIDKVIENAKQILGN